MSRALALALLAVTVATARADGAPRLDVAVGETVDRDVGVARGWFCDDPSLVRADLVTRGDHNVWIVTGVKAGRTLCRVGTDLAGPHLVIDVHVLRVRDRP